MSLSLQPAPDQTARQLRADLAEARRQLVAAEADLAAEQAEVNRFRMHCRLKIGVWVDQVLELRAEKQDLLTRLQLAQDFGLAWDEEKLRDEAATPPAPEAELILPTDVPHDKSAEKRLYRELARRFHPDLAATSVERAYSTTLMAAVNTAYANRDLEALRDLAGELDPALVANMSQGETEEVRQLRRQWLGCQRRRRKVIRQLNALRQENTARLWRKAQQLEAEGGVWWEEVRQELAHEIERLQTELAALRNCAAAAQPGRPSPDRR